MACLAIVFFDEHHGNSLNFLLLSLKLLIELKNRKFSSRNFFKFRNSRVQNIFHAKRTPFFYYILLASL